MAILAALRHYWLFTANVILSITLSFFCFLKPFLNSWVSKTGITASGWQGYLGLCFAALIYLGWAIED
jgi:hypothetical protein